MHLQRVVQFACRVFKYDSCMLAFRLRNFAGRSKGQTRPAVFGIQVIRAQFYSGLRNFSVIIWI